MRPSNTQTQKPKNAGSVKTSITKARQSVSNSTIHLALAGIGQHWLSMEERKDGMPSRNRLIACVIRQYGAGIFRAWVSLNKGHTVCLGAYQDEAEATETIDRFMDTYQEGQIKAPEDILPHIDSTRARDPALAQTA
jgi:hypothetical protein